MRTIGKKQTKKQKKNNNKNKHVTKRHEITETCGFNDRK